MTFVVLMGLYLPNAVTGVKGLSVPIAVPTVTYSMLVGQVVRELRRQHNRSQADVAAALQITQSAWSKLERGAVPMTAEQLFRLGKCLGVDPSQILIAADDAAERARHSGVEVVAQPKEGGLSAGVALVGAAALGAIIAVAVASLLERDEDS